MDCIRISQRSYSIYSRMTVNTFSAAEMGLREILTNIPNCGSSSPGHGAQT